MSRQSLVPLPRGVAPRCLFVVAILAVGSLPTCACGQETDQEPEALQIPIKLVRYGKHVFSRYDKDRDGKLSQREWEGMQGTPQLADRDNDSFLTLDEFTQHVARYGRRRRIRLMPDLSAAIVQTLPLLLDRGDGDAVPNALDSPLADGRTEVQAPAPKDSYSSVDVRRFTPSKLRVPQSLPVWFYQRDRDGDGQLTFAEFAPTAAAMDLREFRSYDRNGDGVITPKELEAGPQRLPRDEDPPE